MADFTVVGHVAIDRILTRRGERTQLGGPPTYMSLAARLLNGSLNTVTKVGDDIPEQLQRQMAELKIDVSNQTQRGAETADPTGAGDVFLGGFMIEFLRGEDPLWCASVGTAVASCIVETLGPRIDADRGQIQERSEEVYEGIERL